MHVRRNRQGSRHKFLILALRVKGWSNLIFPSLDHLQSSPIWIFQSYPCFSSPMRRREHEHSLSRQGQSILDKSYVLPSITWSLLQLGWGRMLIHRLAVEVICVASSLKLLVTGVNTSLPWPSSVQEVKAIKMLMIKGGNSPYPCWKESPRMLLDLYGTWLSYITEIRGMFALGV